MTNLTVCERDSVLVVDSRLIALDLGIANKNLLETLDNYLKRIEAAFGVVRFETEKPLKGSKGGRPERVAYLTEDQAALLMTFSRNTERVVDCKVALVQAFSKAKQLIKEVIPAQSQEIERIRLELQLIQAKQRYQDTGYAIQLSTSPAVLEWLRGEAPPPPKVEYKNRFIDALTGKEIGSSEGRSLTQLITDAGLNPKSARDRNRVKRILKCYGFDYDKKQRWSSASYLREYLVLEDEAYTQAMNVVLGEVLSEGSQPNLFIHQMQQATLAHQAGERSELVGE
jgi:phage regulator Rha-like protein